MRNNSLDATSLLLQIYNLILLLLDYNNADLMRELQKQDNEYLVKILKNQEEILKILNERRENS